MDATLMVTLLSLALAATMSLVAWRVVREDRRRSDARVGALAAGIHGAPMPASPDLSRELFAEPAPAGSRLPMIGAAGLAVAIVAASGVLMTSSATAPVGAAIAPAGPLELVALEHVRDRETLRIHGVVRNPAGGAPLQRVTAVVLAFGGGDAPVATERAAVMPDPLTAGAEATFSVTLPHAAAVERYRVSFRTDDRVVAHVDDRD